MRKTVIIIACLLMMMMKMRPTRGTIPDENYYCVSEEFEHYGCECGHGYYQPLSDSFACKNGIYSLDCNLNQTRIESINKLDYLIALVEETSSVSEICWSAFSFANALKLSSHTFSYLQFRPSPATSSSNEVALHLTNVFEIDSFAFSSIKLRAVDVLTILLENSGIGIFSSLMFKPRCFGAIKSCKRFEMRNFYQLSKLYLKTSYFEGSEIDTLWIENVNDFGGFEADLTNQTGYVRNLVVTKCYMKTLRMQTMGVTFGGALESLQVTWSGVSDIESRSFQDCCHELKSLNLGNNLLTVLSSSSLRGLSSLEHLTVESNPIEWLEPAVFDPVRSTLRRLNLMSTQIKWLNETFKSMNALNDLMLGETRELEFDNLDVILLNAPRLEYLDLSSSGVLRKHRTLNPLIDKLSSLLIDPESNRDLKFIDLSNSWSISLNDSQFRASFGRRGQCLWRSLLDKVFVRLNPNHPCDCTLFYFYRNLINYHFPVMNFTWAQDIQYYQVDSYDNTNVWSNIVTSLLPKCYASFWLQTFNFDLIKKFESQCGFISDFEFDLKYNCSAWTDDDEATTTTRHHERHSTSTTATTTTTTTTMFSPISTIQTPVSKTTTTAKLTSQRDLFKREIINSSYTLPIVLGLVGVALLAILLIILKTRYDYKNKFLKIYEKTVNNAASKEPKELDLIL